MSDAFSASRRRVLGLLAGLPSLFRTAPAVSAPEEPSDRGIGGTGARPPENETPDGDRGIGGTGVIGTIRRFGSIVVNDLRIAYPPDASVHIDGAPARISDLRIGHVVRVVAQGTEGALATRRIDVTSEVVGPVEAAGKGRLTVLGQTVTTGSARGADAVAVGQRVAVYGLRRADGTIQASLIEPRRGGASDGAVRVAGPVRRGADGVPSIGALRLEGLNASLIGRRAVVEGRPTGTGLAVDTARDVSRPFGAGLARASIEGYVTREGTALRFGSGLRAVGAAAAAVPRGGALAVVTTGIGRDGRLGIEAVRVEGRGGNAPGQVPGRAPGQGPGQAPGAGGGPGERGGLNRGAPGSGTRPGPDSVAPNRSPGGPSGVPGRDGGGRNGYPIDTRPGPGGAGGPPSGGFGGGGPIGAPGGAGGPGFGGGGPGFGGGGPGLGGGGGGFGGGRGGR